MHRLRMKESLFPLKHLSRSDGSHHKCTVEDRHDVEGTALSVHANSTDVATAGFQSLSVIYPLATRLDGRQLGCTSTLSFVASVSRFLF